MVGSLVPGLFLTRIGNVERVVNVHFEKLGCRERKGYGTLLRQVA
jgi:hypothetical protein